jgi:hypothetical protein
MRFPIALLGLFVLCGCMGPEGNPNAQSYATEPGGVMTTKPETIGTVSYDPYATPAPFADMQAGQAAINPPQPMPMAPANPRPPR